MIYSQDKSKRWYCVGEEIASAVTHGIGTGLSIAALVLLIVRAVKYAPEEFRGSYVTGYVIFGACLIILYIVSTLYHALTNPTAKKVFGRMDHCSIYLLIAGTYTAYCLTTLHGAIGWVVFGVIWACAVVGITFYAIYGEKMRTVSVITYIPMGLMIICASQPLRANMSNISWDFLLIGGAAYIAGVIFYSMKKFNWTHAVWHVFVIAGSIMHFFSVYYSLVF